ncbi:2,3-bisphosphoglycerate-independent phosphoglycerate mutase [Synoicihabitans lomoniglobus]|uniref:2,3-bisphosphoglycerate-independent phosphoglycerate mutase n=1 Tax=Synoicihabitans lomoniglobus TaxID=2909285 RepID=A0AAF0CNW8_9BACT|nr:2,3-bisphosphoglycerate-independent phosphoglycerate mutase [Opitutaceae bacterium LMO-M01]WED63019.1 2,3-bisphosphoglycerate-independent phosphoglycerate mutase [Opitutaceae bacterium LMO-M01]
MSNAKPEARKPVLLVIRDGWGKSPDPATNATNATELATKPCDDALQASSPRALVRASGLDVGLPDGVMGNSEVGHENIGAGRIVDQELVRLNKLFLEGKLASNATWHSIIERVKAGGRLHLMGIVSDAGVHGMLEHLYGILQQAKTDGISDVFIHAFTDGRDTPPTSGLGYVRAVDAKCAEIGVGKIASVCGRFWSMDRDNRWERVQKAYDLLTGRAAVATATSAEQAVQQYYDAPLTPSQTGDEFVAPTAIVDAAGEPVAHFQDGDAILFYNYRGDRPREITKAFVMDDFDGFDRGQKLDLYYATMTEYEKGLPVHIVSPKPEKLKNILGEVVANAGIGQFRCAETEKNPHVTFFFNNYRADPFRGEDRACPASPKVPTYDEQPEMSAAEVTALSKEAILSGKYGLIVVNFANPDMVGHTGNLEAVVKAVEATDRGVAELLGALASVGGKAIVSADHGNCEQMWNPDTNGPHTAHTLNLVALYVVGEGFTKDGTKMREGGRLGDIAPTVLDLMGLEKPVEMTGESLIVH